MTSHSEPHNSGSTPLMNRAHETAGELLSETDPFLDKEPDNAESSPSRWDKDAQLPLLPRSSWQDQQTFLKILIRAKRSLDIAEIGANLG